jgi:hypothetical protein
MIKILKGNNKTFTIQNGVCCPKNEVGGCNNKDLLSLYKKIGKLLKIRDYKQEVKDKIL